MKITQIDRTLTIQANAGELRESQTLAESFSGLLARCFRPITPVEDEDEEDEEDEE